MKFFTKGHGDDSHGDPAHVPPLDTAHIAAVQVRPVDGGPPAECDECLRSGVKACATHMAEYAYTDPAIRTQQGGKFRWYCGTHAAAEIPRVEDTIRRNRRESEGHI